MTITATHLGFVFGIALGLAGAFGGFSAFIIVLVMGIIGLAAGRVIDSGTDAADLFGRLGRRDRERL